MATYPKKSSELPYIEVIVDLEKTWGIFTSNGGVASYPKTDNPEPKKGDGCRLYKKLNGTEGLFLIKNPDEVYDIPLQNEKFGISSLSKEREDFGTLEQFLRTA